MPNSALGGLPDTRRKLVLLLKASGELTVDEFADSLGITKSAIRQHVSRLEADGLLDHVTERGRPGRPRFRYILTPAAERLFPRRTEEVFVEVLDALDESHPGLSAKVLKQHFSRRIAELPDDLDQTSIEGQVARLLHVLEEDGHMPTIESTGRNSWRLIAANCPLARVAEERPEVCESELDFFQAVAPAISIECVRRAGDGGNSCVHLLTERDS